jgi:hypothetical protein
MKEAADGISKAEVKNITGVAYKIRALVEGARIM